MGYREDPEWISATDQYLALYPEGRASDGLSSDERLLKAHAAIGDIYLIEKRYEEH